MSSTLPKHWPAIVLKFQSLIWELERQMPPSEFNSKRFEDGWVQLNYQGTKILTVLSDPPTGVWPKTFERLEAFYGAVETLVVASYQEGRPESVAEILALCNCLADKVLDGKLLLDYVPEPIFDRAKGKDSAKDEVPIGEMTKPKKAMSGRPRKSLSKKFAAYNKKFPGKLASVSLKELSKCLGVPASTLWDSPELKLIRKDRAMAKENTQDKSKPKTPKGIERRAVASQNRHKEDMEKIDERLDADSQ